MQARRKKQTARCCSHSHFKAVLWHCSVCTCSPLWPWILFSGEKTLLFSFKNGTACINILTCVLIVNTFSNWLKVLVNLQVFNVNLSQSSTKQHELCELSAFSPSKSVQGNNLSVAHGAGKPLFTKLQRNLQPLALGWDCHCNCSPDNMTQCITISCHGHRALYSQPRAFHS